MNQETQRNIVISAIAVIVAIVGIALFAVPHPPFIYTVGQCAPTGLGEQPFESNNAHCANTAGPGRDASGRELVLGIDYHVNCASGRFENGPGDVVCANDSALPPLSPGQPGYSTAPSTTIAPSVSPTPPHASGGSSVGTQGQVNPDAYTRCENALVMKVGDNHTISSSQKVTFTLGDVGAESGTFRVDIGSQKGACNFYEPACTYYANDEQIGNLALTQKTGVLATATGVVPGTSITMRFCMQ